MKTSHLRPIYLLLLLLIAGAAKIRDVPRRRREVPGCRGGLHQGRQTPRGHRHVCPPTRLGSRVARGGFVRPRGHAGYLGVFQFMPTYIQGHSLVRSLSNWGMWVWCGFFLHVLQLLPIRFTWKNLCRIRKSMMTHLQKSDWKSDLPWLSFGYWKVMFVVFLIGYIGILPIVFAIECRVVINTWRRSPVSFETCVFMMFALWSSWNHIPIKFGCPIKANSHLRPIHLRGLLEVSSQFVVMSMEASCRSISCNC